jgi:hypothetical protein
VIETGVPMVKAAEGCTHVAAGKSRWNEAKGVAGS